MLSPVQRVLEEPRLGPRYAHLQIESAIVGVAPAGFRSHQPGYVPDLWLPMRQATDAKLLANHWLAFFSGVMGRLRKGVTHSEAEAELTVIYQQLQAAELPPPRSGSAPISPGDVRTFTATLKTGTPARVRPSGLPWWAWPWKTAATG